MHCFTEKVKYGNYSSKARAKHHIQGSAVFPDGEPRTFIHLMNLFSLWVCVYIFLNIYKISCHGPFEDVPCATHCLKDAFGLSPTLYRVTSAAWSGPTGRDVIPHRFTLMQGWRWSCGGAFVRQRVPVQWSHAGSGHCHQQSRQVGGQLWIHYSGCWLP